MLRLFLAILLPFLVVVPAFAEHPIALQRAETKQIEGMLDAAMASSQESTIAWVHDAQMKGKPGVRDASEFVMATTGSESSAGQERVIFSQSNGKNIFSFFPGGKTELLVDTESAEGFLPYVLESKDGHMRALESTSCRTCHTKDFTPIWSSVIGSKFHHPDIKKLGHPLSILTKVSDHGINLPQVLVKRAARGVYEKVVSRHQDRFKKNAPLLLKLLMACPVAAEEWEDFLKDVRNNSPKLAERWAPVLSGWEKFVEERKQTNFYENVPVAAKEDALYPLFVLHYLGVPPQNIFLFSALSEEEKLFDSTLNFAQLSDPELGVTKRWGPLGAYGGENDDVRTHLAARITYNLFPGIEFASKKYKRMDLNAYLDIKPGQMWAEPTRERQRQYAMDPLFLFNLWGQYGIPPTDGALPEGFEAAKKKWCDQITAQNVDFASLSVTNPASEEAKSGVKGHQ